MKLQFQADYFRLLPKYFDKYCKLNYSWNLKLQDFEFIRILINF